VQSTPLMHVPLIFSLFLGPVFVPVALLKGWIRGAARANPVTPVVEAVRGSIAGAPSHVGLAFAVIAALVGLLGI
jgi:ABC-2 type transport system permease protein